MIAFDDVPVWLACESTDLRKQINGLAAQVSAAFGMDPFSPALYAFRDRSRDRLKILFFDGDYFVLVAKHPGRGRFRWPDKAGDADVMGLAADELRTLPGPARPGRRLRRDEVAERRAY